MDKDFFYHPQSKAGTGHAGWAGQSGRTELQSSGLQGKPRQLRSSQSRGASGG